MESFGFILILPDGLQWRWRRGGLRYFGVFLGNKLFLQKDREGVLDKVKGHFKKWEWILPKMSYRGRVLISTALLHCLACIDPPAKLLSQIQCLGGLFMGQAALGPSECSLPP